MAKGGGVKYSVVLIGFGVALLVVVAGAYWMGRRPWREGQDFLLVRSEVTRLSAARAGDLVKVVGVAQQLQVQNDGPLRAPLTGQPCIGYELSIDRTIPFRVFDGRPATDQMLDLLEAKLKRSHAMSAFRLRDGPCEAIVQGPFLVRLLNDDPDKGNEHRLANSADLLAAALREGVTMSEDDEQIRCREARIVPGTVVCVFGRVDIEPDAGGARESLRGPPLLRIFRGTNDKPIAVRFADASSQSALASAAATVSTAAD